MSTLSSNISNSNDTQQAWRGLNPIPINYLPTPFKGGEVANAADAAVINPTPHSPIPTAIQLQIRLINILLMGLQLRIPIMKMLESSGVTITANLAVISRLNAA
jgi:hypothetical protein